MKVRINDAECIGCGLCPQISAEVFRMTGGIAEVINEEVAEADEENVREAVECCPTEAIELFD
ncbi:MAG: ferredoxin [Elusimicrobia bacterium]|nr:ferredoxin [Elusimicrobiota bacterium]